MTAPLYAFAAAATGIAEACLLGRAARLGPSAFGLLVRVGLVCGVLWIAARHGQLLVAAAAWLTGFVLASLRVYWSLR